MSRWRLNPDARSGFLGAVTVLAMLLIVAGAVQLVFRVPMQYAVPIAWAAFGAALLIQVMLVWVHRFVWIVTCLVLGMGVELFSAGILLRRGQIVLAVGGVFGVFLFGAYLGSRKQESLRRRGET